MRFFNADIVRAALQFACEYGPGDEEGCREILDALGDTERVCVMGVEDLRILDALECKEATAELTHRALLEGCKGRKGEG